ncbi:F0F1 ATP synthase subunit B [Candidatus Erwinia haradaeae]|uniref:ATP synthase subunit b n=1 Tax=Candidatus Erwinia haradaeae TaxID=1922217 RepID=A0A451DG22_9GAMM|nr:F0F1 ATP synthase subunit B [Candidatus Erwinia haradaeae]VFP85567.1 ATP synthase subunit b [Candidatus Erwinia haradaeae]
MNINATILGQAIAFIIFVWFCMHYIWPPLMTAIEDRQKEITDSLVFAKNARKESEITKSNANTILQEAKKDAQAIIEIANTRYSQILEKATIEAEKERKKIVTQAIARINIERQKVTEELYQHLALLTIEGAEKILERSINEDDHRNVINTLITKLSKGIV